LPKETPLKKLTPCHSESTSYYLVNNFCRLVVVESTQGFCAAFVMGLTSPDFAEMERYPTQEGAIRAALESFSETLNVRLMTLTRRVKDTQAALQSVSEIEATLFPLEK